MSGFLKGIIDAIADGKKEIYNPVFIYGPAIHTMKAIDELDERYRQTHPCAKIKRIYGQQYVDGIISAVILREDLKQYKHSLTECDMFIFEGAEYLGGKQSVMEEFYGLFDALWEGGKQIVMTSSRPPKEILSLDDRILTQLEGGIICNVEESIPLKCVGNRSGERSDS